MLWHNNIIIESVCCGRKILELVGQYLMIMQAGSFEVQFL